MDSGPATSWRPGMTMERAGLGPRLRGDERKRLQNKRAAKLGCLKDESYYRAEQPLRLSSRTARRADRGPTLRVQLKDNIASRRSGVHGSRLSRLCSDARSAIRVALRPG